MIPHDTEKPQISPRWLVINGQRNRLYELICSQGYVPNDQNFSDFCESLISGRAWLISGTRGSGKTAFPEAVAAACNLTTYIVAGRDGLKQEEILYGWDQQEQAEWMNEHIRLAKRLPEDEREDLMRRARRAKWKRDFLVLGEVGLAYDHAARSALEDLPPPVLILDESDKFGSSLEDSLLMPLERGLIYIPRLDEGFVGVADWISRPIVVTTSNDLRHKLSGPFVSRHVFSRFATPSIVKELAILHARNKQASPTQLAIAIKLLDGIRGVAGLEDYPSLRESIDVLDALVRDKVDSLDEERLVRYFCYFAKSGESQELLKLQIDYLLLTATSFQPLIDNWLSAKYPQRAAGSSSGCVNQDQMNETPTREAIQYV